MQEKRKNMLTGIDKKFILDSIKEYYQFKNNADFARFLGITPQGLSNWYARNSFDYHTLYLKCVDIDADWLHTGRGEMLRKDPSNHPNFGEAESSGLITLKVILKEKEEELKAMKKLVLKLEELLRNKTSGLNVVGAEVEYKEPGSSLDQAAEGTLTYTPEQ